MNNVKLGITAFIIITCVTSNTNPLLNVKPEGQAKKFAKTTKTPVFRNWKKLILTIKTVLYSVKV